MADLYDKRGIPIERGDIVKVFHFVGARRKRHYMYKQCLGVMTISSGSRYIAFSHLNFIEDRTAKDGPYLILPDGGLLSDYEIVQSIKCDHDARTSLQATGGGDA